MTHFLYTVLRSVVDRCWAAQRWRSGPENPHLEGAAHKLAGECIQRIIRGWVLALRARQMTAQDITEDWMADLAGEILEELAILRRGE